MNPNELLTQFGVAGLLFIILMIILKWVLDQMGKILDREHMEREKWQSIIMGFQDCISLHTAQAKEFHIQVFEAHRLQRDEHERIIKIAQDLTEKLKAISI